MGRQAICVLSALEQPSLRQPNSRVLPHGTENAACHRYCPTAHGQLAAMSVGCSAAGDLVLTKEMVKPPARDAFVY
jgi:hypothetical protein